MAEERRELVRAIQSYALAAYPPGGSECAQVARETLMNTATLIETGCLEGKFVEISSRQRPLLKAAVNWYCGEMKQEAGGPLHQGLLRLLEKPVGQPNG